MRHEPRFEPEPEPSWDPVFEHVGRGMVPPRRDDNRLQKPLRAGALRKGGVAIRKDSHLGWGL